MYEIVQANEFKMTMEKLSEKLKEQESEAKSGKKGEVAMEEGERFKDLEEKLEQATCCLECLIHNSLPTQGDFLKCVRSQTDFKSMFNFSAAAAQCNYK